MVLRTISLFGPLNPPAPSPFVIAVQPNGISPALIVDYPASTPIIFSEGETPCMTGTNGHALENGMPSTATVGLGMSAPPQFSPGKIKELVAALEVPFDPAQIEWRVMNTTKNQQPMRGQVVPYADQRAYTDRLNTLFTPAGWTRKYTI